MKLPARADPDVINELLVKLGKPGVADIIDAAARVGFSDEPMILGGSLGVGLGNGKSDIDVLLLNTTPDARPTGPFQFFPDQERIEVSRVRMADLSALVDGLAADLAGDDCIDLTGHEAQVLSRMAYGCHVGGPPLDPAFEARLADTCHRALIRRGDERARHEAVVALLARTRGRNLIASWSAREAADAVLQTSLLRAGVPYASAKWLYVQLRASGRAPAHPTSPYIPPAGDAQAVYADACVAEVGRALGLEPTLDGLGRHAVWDTGGLRHHRLGRGDVLVHGDENAVTELAASERPAWAELSPERDHVPIGSETPEACALAWRLYELGLVTIRWTRGVCP